MLRIMEKWQKGKHRPGIILSGLVEKIKTNKNWRDLSLFASPVIFQIAISLWHPPTWHVFLSPPTLRQAPNCGTLCAAGLIQTWTSHQPIPSLTFISKAQLGNGLFCWRQLWGTERWKSTEGNWLKQSRDCLTGQSCLAVDGAANLGSPSTEIMCPTCSEWNLAGAKSIWDAHEEFSLLHLQAKKIQERTWTSLRTEWEHQLFTRFHFLGTFQQEFVW